MGDSLGTKQETARLWWVGRPRGCGERRSNSCIHVCHGLPAAPCAPAEGADLTACTVRTCTGGGGGVFVGAGCEVRGFVHVRVHL